MSEVNILHRSCGKVALKYDHRPQRMECLSSRYAIGLNGEKFSPCGTIVCGSCGKTVRFPPDVEPEGGFTQ